MRNFNVESAKRYIDEAFTNQILKNVANNNKTRPFSFEFIRD